MGRPQPLFVQWKHYLYNEEMHLSPDGTEKYPVYSRVRDEVFEPKDATNANAHVRRETIEYLEVQAKAGLKVLAEMIDKLDAPVDPAWRPR